MTVSYAQNSDRPQSIKKLKTSATDYRTRHYWLTPHGKNQPVRSNPEYESDTDVSDTRQTCRERNSEASTIKRSHPSKKRLLIENPGRRMRPFSPRVRMYVHSANQRPDCFTHPRPEPAIQPTRGPFLRRVGFPFWQARQSKCFHECDFPTHGGCELRIPSSDQVHTPFD